MDPSQNIGLLQSSAYCTSCGKTHSLDGIEAIPYCKELISTLDENKRIDLSVSAANADPSLSTDYLFGPARGQMFGVMVYLDCDGQKKNMRAFSGQYNGRWNAPGWVPPIINADEFYELTESTRQQIKSIGLKMEQISKDCPQHNELGAMRKRLSQGLMREIHAIYRVHNFKGQVTTMPEITGKAKGIPAGTGDCCAPKLLNFAASNGYTPVSIAEFYYGKTNKSGTKIHKKFYPSCKDKCGLILGYMLCGLD